MKLRRDPPDPIAESPPDPDDFDSIAAFLDTSRKGIDSWGPYIILQEDHISPVALDVGETLRCSMDYRYDWIPSGGQKETLQKRVWTHDEVATKRMTYNHVILLRYKQFHGVQNAIVWVVGYKDA